MNVFWNDLKEIEEIGARCRSVGTAVTQLTKVKLNGITRGEADLKSVVANLDAAGLKAITEKHAGDKPYETKWLRSEYHLRRNLKRIYRLGLNSSKKLDILDIGSGPAYFCRLCEHFGHNVTALDLDDQPLFNDLVKLFGVQRFPHRVEPFKSLPEFGKRFDLVTAFLTVFNEPHRQDYTWSAPQWEFFLDDLANNVLKDDGRAFFVLNSRFDQRHYTKQDTALFFKKGGKVAGRNVFFENLGSGSNGA